MTDSEINEQVPMLVASVKLGVTLDRADSKEYTGEWDELLKERESEKETCDTLFSLLNNKRVYLTGKNRISILDLKKTSYPLLLCGLAKCYEIKKRVQDEQRVLQEARSLGSQGAEVLLFSLYQDHASEGETEAKLFIQAFDRVKNIDFFSETVVKEINNKLFHRSVVVALALAYLALEKNANKAHECLIRALEADWPDDYKDPIRELLSHFRQNLFGGYTYVQ